MYLSAPTVTTTCGPTATVTFVSTTWPWRWPDEGPEAGVREPRRPAPDPSGVLAGVNLPPASHC
jgi:hypothetical protein